MAHQIEQLWAADGRHLERRCATADDPAVAAEETALLAAPVAGKARGFGLAARLLRWPRGEATVVGWLCKIKALIMLIIVKILLDRGIITPTALPLMAVGSTTIPMATPHWLRLELS